MAEMTQSMVAVVNRALVKLGQGAAACSLDNTTSLGGIVQTVWPGSVALAMSLFDWSIARKTYATTKLADTPENGWAYGFQLPATRIGDPVAVLTDVVREVYLREFMIEGGFLYTNVEPVWVRCKGLVDPDYWDEGFKEAFAMLLAADLAVPLLQDADLAASYRAQALGSPQDRNRGGLFGALITLNTQAQPQGRRFLDSDPLTVARFG